MAIAFVNDSALIGTTEYDVAADSTTLGEQTDDVELEGYIRFASIAAGDQFKIVLSDKVNGTMEPLWETYVEGVQPGAIVVPRFIVGEGWRLTTKKLAGTDRTAHWSLRKLTNVLADGEITEAKFGNGAISGRVIAADAIDSTQIRDGALTEAKFADNAVSNRVIDDGAINNAKIADGAITAAKLAADAITAAKVAADVGTEIAAGVLAAAIEGSRTLKQTLTGLWSVMATKVSGFNTGTLVFRDAADLKDRMTIVTDATGRITVTITDLD